MKILLENIREEIKNIRAGDELYLSGRIYTARDAAHKTLSEILDAGMAHPFYIKHAAIY
jgi:fumarate hydratase subunit beta